MTGENFTAADRHARACWNSGLSVLPPASPDQLWLEGQFLWALSSLKFVGRGRKRADDYELLRVEPHADHLVIKLDPARELSYLAARVLPAVDERSGYIHGIPGLRFRMHPRGLSLYVPGTNAHMVLNRVSERAWRRAVSNAFVDLDPRLHLWSQSPADVTQAESDRWDEYRNARGDDLVSILLRRVRALEILQPSMVDTWFVTERNLHVDLWVTDHNRELANAFIATMTDVRLTPHLAFLGRDGTWLEFGSASGGRIVVRVELHPTSPFIGSSQLGVLLGSESASVKERTGMSLAYVQAVTSGCEQRDTLCSPVSVER